jgi:hypothetical protein
MKRLALVLLLCALIAGNVTAHPGGATVTLHGKYVTPDGNTAPLTGYVRWATSTMFTGLTLWQTMWLDADGVARITLPLPVICWSGTEQCFTLDGQWLFWAITPLHASGCLPYDPPDSASYRGVVWVAEQDVSMGFIWECTL